MRKYLLKFVWEHYITNSDYFNYGPYIFPCRKSNFLWCIKPMIACMNTILRMYFLCVLMIDGCLCPVAPKIYVGLPEQMIRISYNSLYVLLG